MLKTWNSHLDYLEFIRSSVNSLNDSQLKKFHSYSHSLEKLTSLNLDPLAKHLAPYYSSTGRPALHQAEIFRSLILMMDQGKTSITRWVDELASDDLLAILIGCHPDSLPPLGSYYDFISRLWLRKKELDQASRKHLFHFPKNVRPKVKPGKGKKLPNRHPDIVKKIVSFVFKRKDFPFHYEKLLQEIFSLIAIVPSMNMGLIPDKDLTISGDGTCVHCHSSSLGIKVCDCRDNGIFDCKCDRKFSDPDASYGWDSDLGTWYFGYTLYILSFYNPDCHVDLPLHIRFLDARRHDSVGGLFLLLNSEACYPISLLKTFVWIPQMTIIQPMSCARSGELSHLLTLTPTGDILRHSHHLFLLQKTGFHSALACRKWFITAFVKAVPVSNGVAPPLAAR